MGQMGIFGQPGCGLSFRLNFLFGKIRVKLGLEDKNFAKHEGMPKTQNTTKLAPNAVVR